MRHGRLIVLLLGGWVASAWGATPPDAAHVLSVTTPRFELDYTINPAAQPIDSVELWYTFDDGATWRSYGLDEDVAPPMKVLAPEEGLCGFYFVVSNAAGKSPPPSPKTEPQVWVFIDHTPPIAQLHPPRIERVTGSQRVAHLRWTAIDAHLDARPIDLAYRVLPDGAWMDVAPPVENAGQYNWRMPPEIAGEVMFRLTVRDRAGNVAQVASAAVTVDVPAPATNTASEARAPDGDAAPASAPTPEERRRARDLLRKGRYHELRAEHELAVARLRDALRLDPSLREALVELGTSLYALHQYEESAGAYELAERMRPGDRDTLEGLARTLVALRRYHAAETKLLAIVEHRPEDVEAWLHLGDVAIYQGKEVDARDYYTKAATLRPEAATVVSRAKARLDDLPSLTRNYNDPMETQ